MVDVAGWVSSVSTGETLIVPAGMAATLSARRHGVLMRGWVPDLEQEVIAPARAAVVPDDAIRGLGVRMELGGGEPGEGSDIGIT